VQAALEKERQQRHTVLFPIRLDGAVMDTSKAWAGKGSAAKGRSPTFAAGRITTSIKRQIARLLRDLQAVDAQEVVDSRSYTPPKARITPTETYRTRLRQNLIEHFNLSELRDLCFDMHVTMRP